MWPLLSPQGGGAAILGIDMNNRPPKSQYNSTYSKKLLNPAWQRKRLEILNRDEFTCQSCFDSETTLHVHHKYYERGRAPWDYPPEALVTLCVNCHDIETEEGRYAKEDLIKALCQKGLLSRDIHRIAIAIAQSEGLNGNQPEVDASIIEHLFKNKYAWEALSESFWEDCRKRAGEMPK